MLRSKLFKILPNPDYHMFNDLICTVINAENSKSREDIFHILVINRDIKVFKGGKFLISNDIN